MADKWNCPVHKPCPYDACEHADLEVDVSGAIGNVMICENCGNQYIATHTCLLGGETVDLVNSPPHYTAHPSGVECIQITEHFNFNIGNAIKYLWRVGLKGNEVEDLKKAEWYVKREIERLSK